MYRYLLTGDWHYTDKSPKSRTDDYVSELFRKIQILTKHNIPILQPGDLTDTPFLSYLSFRKLMDLFRKTQLFLVFGQHDLRYRNKGNTPLDALQDAISSFHIVDDGRPIELEKGVCLYGASFEEDIPKIQDKDAYNILLVHKMISPVVQQEWQEAEAYDFLVRNKFDLIVSGDNHKSFESEYSGRHLINCGSLMRSKIDQIDHKPCYYILDMRDYSITKHYIPVADGYEVFDMYSKVEAAERNENMEAFVSGLSQQKEMGLSVMENIEAYMKANSIEEAIQIIIKENANELK
jgi:DNA repair exonuclease SbcCD nuclease subunit